MSHVLMVLLLFSIIAVLHQMVYVQPKKESRIAAFLIMSFLGLNVLWLLFAYFSYDITKLFLKSTASALYLLLIPIYLTFYLKQSKNTGPESEEAFVEKHMQLLLKRGYVFKKEKQYFLTGKGRGVVFLRKRLNQWTQ